MKRTLLTILAAAALSIGAANATVVGTQGLADIGAPTCDTGNINTCTVFNLGNLVSTASQSGAFGGMGTQVFGAISFDITSPTSFTFTSTAFGTFTSTNISTASNVPGAVAFYILGDYTPGTFVGGGPTEAASVTLSLTQTPAHTGSISASGTFADPPSPPGTPEPATMSLFGGALVGLGVLGRKRLAR